ncbi:hypothetical protein B0I35DRAFT_464701 [Stachybotrys elegans]|uniref:Cytidyltransferase-like domain-containing protein n=1 Tax=Stachybotrys elegans TaxID=80388 RepID=A0A8K0SES4_9HYPO|nr:hypothetical protein B0I35DRAFT_464701 [Stachybotrys elegans]
MKRLSDYIEAVYFDGKAPSDAQNRPFNGSKAARPPMLRPRGITRIILYPGSFNPPHKGHFHLLSHVFHNAGDDLHLAAAILVPTNVKRLRDKYAADENAFIFTRAERTALLRDSIPDWAWVFDQSEKAWLTFRSKLETKFKEEGLDVRFILLGGPDWFSAEEMVPPRVWGCVDALTSDVSRSVDFRTPTFLKKLPFCGDWEKPQLDIDRLERQIQAKMRGKPRTEIQDAVSLAVRKIQAVSVCRRQERPGGLIRFVPIDLAKQPTEAPSSTAIRDIINTSPDKDLEKNLGRLVLRPNMLATIVREKIKMGPDGRMGVEDEEPEPVPEVVW